MKSLIEGLPPEVAHRIHPDWRKNEEDYWAKRDELLVQYRDQWIGYANGRVIVTGTSPVEVLHKAQESGEHPFVTCVGREHEPSRMRRAVFAYDGTYAGEPLPVVTMEFRKQVDAPGLVVQGVIPMHPTAARGIPGRRVSGVAAADSGAKGSRRDEPDLVSLRVAVKLDNLTKGGRPWRSSHSSRRQRRPSSPTTRRIGMR